MDISGKVALITGSAKRIGREIAIALAARGARVAIHYRSSADAARATLEEVRAHSAASAMFQADLADVRQIERLFTELRSSFGALDILVNNASEFQSASAEATTPEIWDSQMDANARGPFFVAQHAARLMMERGAGKIVNIVDVAGEVVWPGYLAYSASKAALIAVNRGMAKAYAPAIQVNGVAPGPILFPEHYTEEQKRVSIERTLLQRSGNPKDIVNAVLFLVENDYITGEIIHVDGGRHIN